MYMNEQYLVHFGIKGQKWGVRRFQNEDMSLTPAGKERYGVGNNDNKQRSGPIENLHKVTASRKSQRAAAGSGTLTGKNNSVAANKYKAAKKARDEALNTMFEDTRKHQEDRTKVDWDKHDKAINKAVDAKNKAFKESKNAFKNNKTAGQKVANFLINGPIGAGVYNNMRASGYSAAISEGAVIASTLCGGPIGQLGAYLVTRKGA